MLRLEHGFCILSSGCCLCALRCVANGPARTIPESHRRFTFIAHPILCQIKYSHAWWTPWSVFQDGSLGLLLPQLAFLLSPRSSLAHASVCNLCVSCPREWEARRTTLLVRAASRAGNTSWLGSSVFHCCKQPSDMPTSPQKSKTRDTSLHPAKRQTLPF